MYTGEFRDPFCLCLFVCFVHNKQCNRLLSSESVCIYCWRTNEQHNVVKLLFHARLISGVFSLKEILFIRPIYNFMSMDSICLCCGLKLADTLNIHTVFALILLPICDYCDDLNILFFLWRCCNLLSGQSCREN